jgi:hypothetical protein
MHASRTILSPCCTSTGSKEPRGVWTPAGWLDVYRCTACGLTYTVPDPRGFPDEPVK